MDIWTSIIKFEYQTKNMRITFILACFILIFSACKKDKYTTEPQIKYKSISPNEYPNFTGAVPRLTFSITDKEGDVGLKPLVDTAWVYMTNKLTGRFDSIPFPDISLSSKNNFKADVELELNLNHNCVPGTNTTDSLYYEIYVRDFAGNKSNVITTPEPVYFRCF